MFLANKIIAVCNSRSEEYWAKRNFKHAVIPLMYDSDLDFSAYTPGTDLVEFAFSQLGITPQQEQLIRRDTSYEKSLKTLATKLSDTMTGHYALDPSLAGTLLTTSFSDDEKLLKAFEYARPPFDVTWVESSSTRGIKTGFLIERKPWKDDFCLEIKKIIFDGNGETIDYRPSNDIRITSDGYFRVVDGRALDLKTKKEKKAENEALTGQHAANQQGLAQGSIQAAMREALMYDSDEMAHSTASSILTLLLVVNSRSHMLKLHPPKPDETLRARNLKQEFSKVRPVNMHAIMLDLDSPIFKRPGEREPTPEEARTLLYMTIRHGHFVVTGGGVHWRRPHAMSITQAGALPPMENQPVLVVHKKRGIGGTGEELGPPASKIDPDKPEPGSD